MMNIVYLNEKYLDISEAKISPLDRGFLFGDSVYEVIPVYAGKLFRFDEHIERLRNSLQSIHIKPPLNREQWLNIIEKLLATRTESPKAIYIQISRGATQQRNHNIPADIEPTVFVLCLDHNPKKNQNTQGIEVITANDIRWHACFIKSTNLLANILAKHQATTQQCEEAILIREGYAMEGTSSNLFIVKDDQIVTPPKNELILGGVTRAIVIELAQQNNIPLTEKPITENELHQANEVWISSSTRDVVPVLKINNRSVGSGTPGPLWKKMDQLFQNFKQTLNQI